MFSRDIRRMFEEMDRLFEQRHPGVIRGDVSVEPFPAHLMQAEGYRTEIVDGERTDYYLDDGEWKEVGAEDDDAGVTVEVTAGDDEPTRATIDLSTKLGDRPKTVAEATFNNGILDVGFEASTEAEDE